MQIIGFNFTKITAEKKPEFKRGNSHRTNIEFLDIKKEDTSLLMNQHTIAVNYKYSLSYFHEEKKKEKITAEIILEGNILFAADEKESAEILKDWKKKAIPQGVKIALFNTILRRCSPKALLLEEEINLPPHLPIPQVSSENPEEKKEETN
jgi:hypothetical protein